ncbi:TRAP transporter large permease [Hippea maritima]|uniref:TRAP dicarboxylate transporter, DctM subunit n=1 Tax=Hippea maritima (strain ATCC 700847 / DSM 10411 / MH2) TaxID=760142 RepID=F2LWV4_HIPMA|nr:TRAP transporter large permease subunit [Hippea maritima]AEA33082.1 TRAP dicarboxylate transporter, DctM subunit [Hippea maritima DSM 10411]
MTILMVAALLFLFIAIDIPIAVALGVTATFGIYFIAGLPLIAIAQKLFTALDKFALMAIPFFVLAGAFLSEGGTAKRIIKFAHTMVGHLPGGLTMTSILACAIFAAVSGSGPATVAAIGSIMIPAIREAGYSDTFAIGSITTAGSLGILIPPSIVLIVYGVTVDQSIGDLFLAGVVPGIVITMMLMILTYVMARRAGFKRSKPAPVKEKLKAFASSFWALMLIVIIIGGIYSGIFTPTEAAAVSAVYAFFVAKFIYRDLTWKEVPQVILKASATSAMILFIIANAMLFAYFLTIEQIPQQLSEMIIQAHVSKIMFLAGVNVLLIIFGAFMEPSSIVMVTAPLFFPVAMHLGINPIQLGIIYTINMGLGEITPPVGLNLFVAMGITGKSIEYITKTSIPWFITYLAGLLLATYIPQLSLVIFKIF